MSEFRVNVAGEQVVLAAALRNAQVRERLLEQVRDDEFLDLQHAAIWRALRELKRRGLGYDRAAAIRQLTEGGADDRVVDYLVEIETWDGRIDNLRHHVETMRWDAVRDRAYRDHAPSLLEALRDGREQPEVVRGMTRRLHELVHGTSTGAVARPLDVYREYSLALERRISADNPVYGLGFPAFDDLLGRGFEPGTQTLVPGLSGAGKSCVALNVAMWLSQVGRRPLYFLWETKRVSALDVICSSHTGVPYADIIRGRLDAEQRRIVDRAAAYWLERIRFAGKVPKRSMSTGRRRPTNQDVLDFVASVISESGCDVAFYDLWLRGMVERQPDAIEQTLGDMQDLHEDLGVHGFMLHQINLKDVERRKDKRPTRDAIKGVGGYVEYSDQILAVMRPGMFVPGLDDNCTEIECWKLKDAKWPWTTRWKWEGAYQRISDPEYVEPSTEADGDNFSLDDLGGV